MGSVPHSNHHLPHTRPLRGLSGLFILISVIFLLIITTSIFWLGYSPTNRRQNMNDPIERDESSTFSATQPLTAQTKSPKFLYLTVMKNKLNEPGSHGLPEYGSYRDAANGDESEMIMTTWKEQSQDTMFFGEGSSFGRNRNYLLMEALRRERCNGWKPLYYIFMDDNLDILSFSRPDPSYNVVNASIAIDAETGKEIGSPLRVFEKFLSEWEPAVGVVWYAWQLETGELVNTLQNTDQCFYAIHREAARILLPYVDYFDDNDWWLSNHLINLMNLVFFNNYRYQYTGLRLIKGEHASTVSQMGFNCGYTDWSLMGSFLFDSLREDSPLRQRVVYGNFGSSPGGTPTRKDRKYDEGWEADINVDHPLWATNRAFWRRHDCCMKQNEECLEECSCEPVMVKTPCLRNQIPCNITTSAVFGACEGGVCEIGC